MVVATRQMQLLDAKKKQVHNYVVILGVLIDQSFVASTFISTGLGLGLALLDLKRCLYAANITEYCIEHFLGYINMTHKVTILCRMY